MEHSGLPRLLALVLALFVLLTGLFRRVARELNRIDNLSRGIVILDVSKMPEDVTILQLADFIAMVTLAQIDPEADTSAYASILNVFEDSGAAVSLTSWDLAYLEGLYNAEAGAANRRAGRSEVSRSIGRAHTRLQAAEDAAADQPQDSGE